jgi:2-succinyl-6-hydroxy-2,4-cyclohexadiene-1-carboxylate synthase
VNGRDPQELRLAGQRVLVWPGGARGPVALLLHGFTGRSESWCEVADRVAGLRRSPRPAPWLVAVDLPGHHPHLPVDRRGGFEGAVERLAALVGRLGLARVHLVGYSMGARLGLGLAARADARIGGATLVGVDPGLQSAAERRERRGVEAGWCDRLRREGVERFMSAWEELPLFASQSRCAPEARRRQAALRRTHDARRLAEGLALLGLGSMPDLWPRLPELPCPVRFVAGELDAKFARLAESAAARAARVSPVLVPDAGHNVVLENPGAIAGLVDEGLRNEK